LNKKTLRRKPEGQGPHLQGQAVVGGSLVFAAVVLAVVHVHVVQLQEAREISGCLQRARQRRASEAAAADRYRTSNMCGNSLGLTKCIEMTKAEVLKTF